MPSTILKAVMEEVSDELAARFAHTDAPATRRLTTGALELGYTEGAYRLKIEVDRNAKVTGRLTRLPCYQFNECHHTLSDPNLFAELGNAVARRIKKDRSLVQVLEKIGQKLLASLRKTVDAPEGWRVLYCGPALHENTINVSVSIQPAVAYVALPAVSFRMVLAAFRSGKFKVSLTTD